MSSKALLAVKTRKVFRGSQFFKSLLNCFESKVFDQDLPKTGGTARPNVKMFHPGKQYPYIPRRIPAKASRLYSGAKIL
jgi:hypothetical protein